MKPDNPEHQYRNDSPVDLSGREGFDPEKQWIVMKPAWLILCSGDCENEFVMQSPHKPSADEIKAAFALDGGHWQIVNEEGLMALCPGCLES